jgi:hypothetical protein
LQLKQRQLSKFVNSIEGPQDLSLVLTKDNDLADRDVLPKSVVESINKDRSMMLSSLETMIAGDEIAADESVNADLIAKLSQTNMGLDD